MRLRATTVAALIAALTLGGCKKEKKQEEPPPPPSRGGASNELVSTEIGNGLGLRAGLAPTSVRWERVVVVDEESVVLMGRELQEGVAIRTGDRGRTWTSLRGAVKSWSSWGIGNDGSLALLSGERDKAKPPPGRLAAVVAGEVWFAGADESKMGGPRSFFPDDEKLKDTTIPSGVSLPAVLDGGIVSMMLDRKRSPVLAYTTTGGPVAADPLELPRGSYVPVPYGRPPQLVSLAGGNLEVRPWPKPGDPLPPGSALPNYRADGSALAQLSEGPSCEWGGFSFRRIAGAQPYVIAISGDRAAAIKVPPSDSTHLGCGPEGVVVETSIVDPSDPEKKRKVPQLVRCTFDGKCSEPQSPPFALWAEKHERTIASVPTEKGIIAVMSARAGDRWGMYLAQSTDGGATFELPRKIGEGKIDRGLMELGAIIRLPKRTVLLISADVTGTTRRGWYLLASDDDGNNWGPP